MVAWRHGGMNIFADTISFRFANRAVTLITPSLYVDLRVAADRPTLPKGCTTFAELPLELLAELARATHCFGGLGTVDIVDTSTISTRPGQVTAADDERILDGTSLRICSRRIAVDWQPPPRLKPNRWRIKTQWDAGGWAEWALECDANGQAKYVGELSVKGWRRRGGE